MFARASRRIELTDQGRFYANLVKEALDGIGAGTLELIATRDGVGTISVGLLPTSGTRWLIPRLSSFQQQHPEIALNLVSSDGPLDCGALTNPLFFPRIVDVSEVSRMLSGPRGCRMRSEA